MAAASSSVFLPALRSSHPAGRRPKVIAAARPFGLSAAIPRLFAGTAPSLRRCLLACASTGEKEGEGANETEAAAEEAAAEGDAAEKREANTEAAEAAEATARKILMNRQREEGENNLWSGVAEEVREIEWPAFGRVIGTTGVVLAVIGGSSVALLTVNAVLAELSDRIFAGRGVQDFFG